MRTEWDCGGRFGPPILFPAHPALGAVLVGLAPLSPLLSRASQLPIGVGEEHVEDRPCQEHVDVENVDLDRRLGDLQR